MNHDDHACLVFTISAMKIYVHVYVHINHASNVMCIYSSFMNEAPIDDFDVLSEKVNGLSSNSITYYLT